MEVSVRWYSFDEVDSRLDDLAVYLLLTTQCLVLTTHYSLLTARYSLLTAHRSLLTTHYSLRTAYLEDLAVLHPTAAVLAGVGQAQLRA